MSGPYDPDRVWGLGDPSAATFPGGWEGLAAFNELGVLVAADLHVAARLARLGGDPDPTVGLAVALAVRAPRVGHVSVDLSRVEEVAAGDLDDDVELSGLPWPEPGAWVRAVAESPLVACGEPVEAAPEAAIGSGQTGEGVGAEHERPLRLVGSALYLDRYWRDERLVAAELASRASVPVDPPAGEPSGASWEALAPEDPDQRRAVLHALTRSLTVLVGGPGTGKTTTVARLLAVCHQEALVEGRRPPLVALAAPTGKAAARLEEAVRAEAGRLPVDPAVALRLASSSGATLHRLLGASRSGGFRYRAGNRLPHDTVVVDEASMVSLGLMAQLLQAVRPDARLVLVGDPDQLVSVEAGAVLADVVGGGLPTTSTSGAPGSRRPGTQEAVPGDDVLASGRPSPVAGGRPPIAASVTALRTNHRSGGDLATLAEAVRCGDATTALGLLAGGGPALAWTPIDAGGASDPELAAMRDEALSWAEPMVRLARDGSAEAAASALGGGRVLCAHRHGPAGVGAWNDRIEAWVAEAVPGLVDRGPWYPGRPVMVTTNDYGLGIFNGDTGVVVSARGEDEVAPGATGGHGAPTGGHGAPAGGHGAPAGPLLGARGPAGRAPAGRAPGPGARVVAFAGRRDPVGTSRLSGLETVYAMTVHKSQGSELDRVVLVLPSPASRLLTRELLYTAVTRARRRLLVVGEEAAIRAAIGRRIERASGLGPRLWGPGPR